MKPTSAISLLYVYLALGLQITFVWLIFDASKRIQVEYWKQKWQPCSTDHVENKHKNLLF